MRYTELEKKVIKSFGNYMNYETLDENLSDNATYFTFSEAVILTGIEQNRLKGVIGSLIKKGICYIDDMAIYSINDYSEILVTDEGIRTYYSLKKEIYEGETK